MMNPILIYGYPQGTSLGLVAAMEWLGQPYQLCRVDMLGEMRTPPYARINGRHETPALITDEGRPLSETMAIALWLAARDVDRRISFDPRSAEADRMHQIMAFLNTGFTGAFSPLWTAMELTTPDPDYERALVRFGRDAVLERHDRLEAMLGDEPWLAGDHPTLADALLAGLGRWLEFHAVAEVGRWPRLAAVRERIEADPAVRYAAALEAGDRPTGTGACTAHLSLDEVLARLT